jgi:hypothetical protein
MNLRNWEETHIFAVCVEYGERGFNSQCCGDAIMAMEDVDISRERLEIIQLFYRR